MFHLFKLHHVVVHARLLAVIGICRCITHIYVTQLKSYIQQLYAGRWVTYNPPVYMQVGCIYNRCAYRSDTATTSPGLGRRQPGVCGRLTSEYNVYVAML